MSDTSDLATAPLRVLRGAPDDRELAAVTAVLLAVRSGRGDEAPKPGPHRTGWDRTRAGYVAPTSWTTRHRP
ncbi:hypothetical protein GCM10023347_02320 [Streptomyces chumphonensis]|uniref:Acyl-CoA carboxylase subunit epsilon n=1 Tax=Streptomyces chumphonensis TaxID=1214925 RepID=A0A927F3J8_9ACTN|nr:acyl-CoA carboxylase subunit epsilon [Streptomyces chumphonensis]MBD3934556.1 acyl-CoA carboxylase subunit epsilon [Streptomyces chumphonensis]